MKHEPKYPEHDMGCPVPLFKPFDITFFYESPEGRTPFLDCEITIRVYPETPDSDADFKATLLKETKFSTYPGKSWDQKEFESVSGETIEGLARKYLTHIKSFSKGS